MRALRLIGLAGVVSAALATSGGATTPGADGLIVFAQEVKGHYQLFTIRPDGSGAKQITHSKADVLNPDWSPDGKTLVAEFDRAKTAGFSLLTADGTDERNLTPKGFQAA